MEIVMNLLRKTLPLITSIVLAFPTVSLCQWQQANGPYGGVINSITCDGGILLAGTNSGLFRSTNEGTSWTSVPMGPANVYELQEDGGMVFAGTNNGFYLSSDSGTAWSYVGGFLWLNTPVPVFSVKGNLIVFYSQKEVVVGSSPDFHWGDSALGVYYFLSGGLNPDTVAQCAAFVGNSVFVGTNEGIYVSADSGKTWSRNDSGLTCTNISALTSTGGIVFAGTDTGGVFRSTNNGATWVRSNSGLTVSSIKSLAVNENEIYAGTNDGGVFVSSDFGATWKSVNSGLTNLIVNSLAFDSTSAIAGTGGNGVFMLNGSWTPINAGITADTVDALLSTPGYLLSGTTHGGVYRSTDDGTSWSAVNTGLSCLHVDAFLNTNAGVFAATLGGGVFLSTDNGETWVPRNGGMARKSVASLTVSGTNILAGTRFSNANVGNLSQLADSGMIYISTDNGGNWVPADSGLFAVYALANVGGEAYAASWQGVSISNDNGLQWASDTTWPKGSIYTTQVIIPVSFYTSGTEILAGTEGSGIYISTDNGGSWGSVGESLYQVAAITTLGRNVFASGFFSSIRPGQGVFRSTLDSLSSWTPVDSDFTDVFLSPPVPPVVNALATSAGYLFAGTCGLGVWRVPLSEVTGVKESSPSVPARFALHQNYPNPFNPSTEIDYSVPKNSFVTLKVYNVLGQEVATLFSGMRIPGQYQATFNASRFASGVYFYRLRAGSYSMTKKMILLK